VANSLLKSFGAASLDADTLFDLYNPEVDMALKYPKLFDHNDVSKPKVIDNTYHGQSKRVHKMKVKNIEKTLVNTKRIMRYKRLRHQKTPMMNY